MSKILRKPLVVIMLAVFCTALWGSAFPAVKTGYELFSIQDGSVADKLVFAGMRFGIAGLVILLIVRFIPGKSLKIRSKDYKGIVLLGLVQTFAQYFLFYIALSNMSGSKGAILNATGTFFIVIFSHFLIANERLTVYKTAGCLFGFSGIVLINLSGESMAGFHLYAEGFMLLAALASAIGSIYSKVLLKDMDALVLTGYQLFLGGALLLLIGLMQGGRLGAISLQGILLFAYLVFISSAAFGIWTLLIKYNEVSKVSIYKSLTPVFGTILSGIFLSEEIVNLKNLIALLLVVTGIYLVNAYKSRGALCNKNE